jgi:hypothetical protein
MRPVTKGNPTNYAFYTGPSETGYTFTFVTNKPVAIVYNAIVGATTGPAVTFTVLKTMTELLNVSIKGYVFPNPRPGKVAKAKLSMQRSLANTYRTARPDLVAELGEFCSFCELPIADHLLPVEHRAPKSLYPTYTVWWWNFLLACRDCNSKKGNKPPRAEATGWTGSAAPTEEDLIAAIKAQYYWPDIDANTYRVISRTYRYDTNTVAPTTLGAADAASRANRLVSFTATTVRADVQDTGMMHNNTRVEVQIVRNGGNATIGDRTLGSTGINETTNGRCAQRTRVWLAICTELDNIMTTVGNVVGAGNKRQVFNGMWSTLLRAAVRAGFYSVWVDITEGYPFPAGMTTALLQADLGAQFVWDTNPANNASVDQVFRGVDVTQVP